MSTKKMTRKLRKNRKKLNRKLEKGTQNIESMLASCSKNEPETNKERQSSYSRTDLDSLNILEKEQKHKDLRKKQKNFLPEIVVKQQRPILCSKQTTEESKHKNRKENTITDELILPIPSSSQEDTAFAENKQMDLISTNDYELPGIVKNSDPADGSYSQEKKSFLKGYEINKEDQSMNSAVDSTPMKDSNDQRTLPEFDEREEQETDFDLSDTEVISPSKGKRPSQKLILSDSESDNSDSYYSSTASLPSNGSGLVSKKSKRRKYLPRSSEDESVEFNHSSPERSSNEKNSNEDERDHLDTELKQEVENLEPVHDEKEDKRKRFRNPAKKAFHEKLALIRRKRSLGDSNIETEEDISEPASEKVDTSDDDSSNDESFIVDEEEDEETLGARALLPPEFSMTSHQGLRAHFANFLRHLIKQILNLQIDRSIDEHFLFSRKTIRRRLFSSVESNVISSIWKPNFINILKNRPIMTNRRCEATYGCDACNIHSRLSTQLVRFKGHLYNRDTYKVLENDLEYHEESKKDWLLGSSCYERSRLAHRIFHWEYEVSKEITTQLSLAGYYEARALSIDQMYQCLEENNYPESSWQEYCKLLKLASSSLLNDWRSSYRKHG
ncbi:fungal protein [Schizosaccharomyces cryophilus OY26]|uniref:Fungal protein n=1 Tax=Schizosaccharomyces cryophilus (strain OY26 / ATCC MYA-4695 / CBS 11777 / NBRC 106824 / NRRL Y48691) TaxID=653667 RepID=S9XCX4_SCHCR|nr:uncharacterized protein SPOG_00117 [Schizosaccharomyces cryophilus OY26]EPY51691.1 fungal protein [Schizosaccharomyces cryophilus OY26]